LQCGFAKALGGGTNGGPSIVTGLMKARPFCLVAHMTSGEITTGNSSVIIFVNYTIVDTN
jgi:hypothetical protein